MIEGLTSLSRRGSRYRRLIVRCFVVLFRPFTGKGTVTVSDGNAATSPNIIEGHGKHDFTETGIVPAEPLTRSTSTIRQAAAGILQAEVIVARNKCLVYFRVSYSGCSFVTPASIKATKYKILTNPLEELSILITNAPKVASKRHPLAVMEAN